MAVHNISLEAFIARPDRDDDECEELIEGELIVSPGAKPSHASIVGRLRAPTGAAANSGI